MKLVRLVISRTIAGPVEKGRAAHRFIDFSTEGPIRDWTLRHERLVEEELSKNLLYLELFAISQSYIR